MTKEKVILIGILAAGAAYAITLRPDADTPPDVESIDPQLFAPFPDYPQDIGLTDPSTPAFVAGPHHEWDNQIVYACGLYGMNSPLAPLLVKAIISHESGSNPQALGDAGCSKGLMQVNGCAHPQLDRDRGGAYNLFNVNENILAGCQLLANEYRQYWPDWSRVMVGYNGPALARSGIRSNAYSQAVETHFRRYAGEAGIAV